VNMKQVDLVLFGHVHNYERTCSVYQNKCKAIPIKDQKGVDTYDNGNYSAPVHAVIGMAGFALDKFSNNVTNFPFVTLFSIMIVLGCGYSTVAVTLLTLIFGQNTADAAVITITKPLQRPLNSNLYIVAAIANAIAI